MAQIKIYFYKKKLQVFLLIGTEGCERLREENYTPPVHVLAHLLAVCLKGQKWEVVKTIITL